MSVRRGKILSVVILGIVLTLSAVATAAAPRPYVFLGGYWIDKHDKYGWAYFTERPGPPEGSGPHGAQRPCISVAAFTREGSSLRSSESELCYGTPQFLTARSEPLIVSKSVLATEKGSTVAFGVAAPNAARYLRLTLKNGYRTVPLHKLNPVQARKTRLRPFRHVGFLMRGQWCIQQIVVLNEAKEVLWDSSSDACSPEEPAARWQT